MSLPRLAFRFAATLGWTSVMISGVTAAQLVSARENQLSVFDWWRRRWCRGLLRVQGIEVQFLNDPPRSENRGRLVLCNHRSPFDILVLLSAIEGSFLSRADVAGWPLIGYCARRAGTIFVERTDKSSGRAAIDAMRERLVSGGTVLAFPEGTTFEGDQIRPLRAGAFVAVADLDADIVPVGLAYESGAEFIQPTMGEYFRSLSNSPRIRLAARFGEPLAAQGTVDELRGRVAESMQSLVGSARAAVALS